MSRKACFLDRDGTINHDPGYINHPDQMELIPGAGAALARLVAGGFELVVVTNQSGVGRGKIKLADLSKIHERLNELLVADGVSLEHFAICIHHPDENCDCRKPSPKLIHEFANKLDVDLTQSVMVGDRPSDMEAGRNAGCGAVALVKTGRGRESQAKLDRAPNFVGEDLGEVTGWILKNL